MADGAVKIFLKNKLKEKRKKLSQMFTLSLENKTSVKQKANIFSNKTGFSVNPTIDNFSEVEIDGWSNDWALDGELPDRLVGIVYNDTIEKFVVFRGNSTGNKIKIYTINDDNSYTFQATLTHGTLTGANEVIYSATNDKYYFIGDGGSSKQSAQIINADFTLGTYQDWTSGTAVSGGMGVKESTGDIFFTDGFGADELVIYNPNTDSNVQTVSIPSVAGGYAIKNVVYDETTDKFFTITQGTPKSEIFVVDDTTYSVSLMHEYGYNSKGDICIIENQLYVITVNQSNNFILEKFDLANETLISSRELQRFNDVGSNHRILTDNLDNFYILTYNKIAGYNKAGDLIFSYSGGSGSYNLGGNPMIAEGSQFFNSKNKTFGLNGNNSNGTFWVLSPAYVSGLNSLTINTGNYQMALAEFNTMPISVSHILLFYKNGGNSLNNILKYKLETMTGAIERRMMQPRNYVDATSSDDKVIEMDLANNPIIIDSAHFFDIDIEASETVTFCFFYSQADKKDLLYNKLLG